MHLNYIRKCLERAHWRVAQELDGDGYRISGVWVVERPDGTDRFHAAVSPNNTLRRLLLEKLAAQDAWELPI